MHFEIRNLYLSRLLKILIAPVFLICVGHLISIQADVFSALVSLKPLLTTDKELPNVMKEYISIEKENIKNKPVLMKLAEIFLKPKFENVTDAEKFLGHPVNIFHLIKRLYVIWRHVKTKLNKKAINRILARHRVNGANLQFPSKEDMIGAAVALSRLQKIYHLSVSKIADGEIIEKRPSFMKMSATDCFEMGQQLYKFQEYENSLTWLLEAEKRHTLEERKQFPVKRYLELLSYNYFLMGKNEEAIKHLDQYLELDPENEKIKSIQKLYKELIDPSTNDEDTLQKAIVESMARDVKKDPPVIGTFDHLEKKYVELCNNHRRTPPLYEHFLKCYYATNNSPFLLLQPAKVEDVHIFPWIAVYHNIISDKEIEQIKLDAIPMLQRADVFMADGSLAAADFRISKSAWLENEYFPTANKISQRLQEITGLDMSTAEDLQVVNYGIGGHYETHIDFSLEDDAKYKDDDVGSRIATALFYMSDVEAGGSTVFPSLNIGVAPEKGSAVFWYNIRKSGEGDFQTAHGACPVLVGNKWVANKWIHSYGQEFRRKCAEERENYEDKEFDI